MNSNPLDLSDRNILITGASSGIGRDTAILLSELGARVVISGRDENRLEETRAAMSGDGHSVEVRDICNHETTDNWLRGISSSVGRLDSLVHCAGVSQTQALRFMEVEAFRDLVDINLTSSISLAKAFRQKPVRSLGTPKIVFISSVAAVAGFPGMAMYSATKSALIGLTKTLATELAGEEIRVNCLIPGLVATEMKEKAESAAGPLAMGAQQPLGIGKPRDVAGFIAFLVADTGNWITGQSYVIDGGLTA